MAPRADLRAAQRCERCRLPPRWCVCAAHRTVDCPLQVEVLMHQRELWRPSSTGQLITRTITGARQHVWLYDKEVERSALDNPHRALLVLHPNGEPFKSASLTPDRAQVVLLDGAWRETTLMARRVAAWGRTVSLPMEGESRYWLRTQQAGSRFSTVEALIFLLRAFELTEAAAALQVQFELHVYAGLRARGQKQTARDFLESSPLGLAVPEMIAQLDLRRPA